MEYATLGNTQLVVSRVAFGCWATGGHGYGRTDDTESIASIREALERGVNFFDTADVYGFGHSERILCEALGVRRREVVIATKFGVCWDDAGKTFRDCSPKRAEAALEASLRRLDLESLPLYQVHWHDGVTPICDTIEALLKFQKAGKIQHFGCSNFSGDLLGQAGRIARPASNQLQFSVAHTEAKSLLEECFRDRVGNLVYGVLGRGALSGKYDLTSRFGEKDTRAVDLAFRGEELERNIRLANKLRVLGEHYGKSPSQVAIRWVLDNPFITSAIVGMKNVAQVLENSGAADWGLSSVDYSDLADSAKI
ncbi:MAG: aldo/keto reductase [Syntrophobacteraceae bacterium]|nr:aldo/keto reductase [Syntrophobacteraceae bacterium]MDR3561374.1 aldo/keto reductase [Negativicutes bacterium]